MQVHLHADFFTAHVHNQWLVESKDAEPLIRRAECEVIHGFSTEQKVGAPNPHTVQRSTVYS